MRKRKMKNLGTAGYKLLTPGPLTTTETVKEVMLFDHCTWDDDYKEITQKIRRDLLKLAQVEETEYSQFTYEFRHFRKFCNKYDIIQIQMMQKKI